MHYRYTITPAGDFEQITAQILDRAAGDARISRLVYARCVNRLVFCGTPEEAEFQRQRFEQTGKVSQTYGVIDCRPNPGYVVVDQTCADASRDRLADFVGWILCAFAPCVVHDQDSDRDITAQVRADPDILFT